jgi:hypothetical protein
MHAFMTCRFSAVSHFRETSHECMHLGSGKEEGGGGAGKREMGGRCVCVWGGGRQSDHVPGR